MQEASRWKKGHPTLKQMPYNKNTDEKLSAVATTNREKPKDNNNNCTKT